MKKLLFFIFISSSLFLSSCGGKKEIVYFANIDSLVNASFSQKGAEGTTIIRPYDELSITVSSEDIAASAPFNPPALVGTSSENPAFNINPRSQNIVVQPYIVDKNGEIKFPTLGTLKLGGMSIDRAKEYMEERLNNYIKNPLINVQILNFKVTVDGEVLAPGIYYFSGRKVTILDAIAEAKSLNLQGDRKNILLIRNNNGKIERRRLDLTKAETLESEYFYLQQNDIIYVAPNEQRQKDANMGQERSYNLTIVTSIISYTLTAISLTVALFK